MLWSAALSGHILPHLVANNEKNGHLQWGADNKLNHIFHLVPLKPFSIPQCFSGCMIWEIQWQSIMSATWKRKPNEKKKKAQPLL